jgi:glycine/D-amino acid oxidase-like deaminating enzyme
VASSEDKARVTRRDMPFSIDLDDQFIDWSEEDRMLLLEDEDFRWLAEKMPGSIHCRSDGGDRGSWLKLGWAFNEASAPATWTPSLNEHFSDIVLRAAARLNPLLKTYYGKLPRNLHHYGGWYTMAEENWPLICPMGQDGAFMYCALSGFGTMTACAGGELCAGWVAEAELPDYARYFSMDRYADKALMTLLRRSNKGLL